MTDDDKDNEHEREQTGLDLLLGSWPLHDLASIKILGMWGFCKIINPSGKLT